MHLKLASGGCEEMSRRRRGREEQTCKYFVGEGEGECIGILVLIEYELKGSSPLLAGSPP
jgi:hypothetical protein